jgi:hypothetical protein
MQVNTIHATLYRDGTLWYLKVHGYLDSLMLERMQGIGWVYNKYTQLWWIDRDEYPMIPLHFQVKQGAGRY